MPINDAIVDLGNGRKTIDFGDALRLILLENWNAANTDNKTPTIKFAETMKGVDFHAGDYLLIYSVSSRYEPVTLTYTHKNKYYTFTLDMFTVGNRDHINKMVGEAERICDSYRADTILDDGITGRIWMKYGVRAQPFDRVAKNFYRYSVDVDVYWRYQRIGT